MRIIILEDAIKELNEARLKIEQSVCSEAHKNLYSNIIDGVAKYLFEESVDVDLETGEILDGSN